MNSIINQSVNLMQKSEKAYKNDNKDKWSNLRTKAKELLKSNGYTYLGAGDYRFVYKLPDENKVLKLYRNSLGKRENKIECENFENAPKEIKENHLAEIYKSDFDGKWLIQEYIPHECAANEAKELSNKLKDNNYYIAEINAWNVGKDNDGNIVAFDYAGN